MLVHDIVGGTSTLDPKHLALGLSVTTLVTIALLRARAFLSETIVKVLSVVCNVRRNYLQSCARKKLTKHSGIYTGRIRLKTSMARRVCHPCPTYGRMATETLQSSYRVAKTPKNGISRMDLLTESGPDQCPRCKFPSPTHMCNLLISAFSVVSNPNHLKELFKDSDQHYKAVNNDSGYLMSKILGQCVGLLSGKSWQSLRSQMEIPFTHMAISNEAAVIREQTRKFVEQLRNSGDFRNGVFDPAKDISFYPFLVVATVLYGDLDAEDIRWLRKIAPVRQKLFTFVIKGGMARFSISKFLPTTANRLLDEFQWEWLSFNESVYKKAKDRGAVTPMVKLWEDCQAGKVSQTQVRTSAWLIWPCT